MLTLRYLSPPLFLRFGGKFVLKKEITVTIFASKQVRFVAPLLSPALCLPHAPSILAYLILTTTLRGKSIFTSILQ
jgi:hypothetical protein